MPPRTRDPRARRQQPADLLAAAQGLVVAADDMRIDSRRNGPGMTAREFADALGEPPPQLITEAEFFEDQTQNPAPVEPSPTTMREDFARAVAEFVPPAPAPPIPPEAPVAVHPAPPVTDRPLTWRSRHDTRSLAFGVRATLRGSAPLTDRMWRTGPVLDQGVDGACVGAAVVAADNALALAERTGGDMLDMTAAEKLYHRAQQLDTIPDSVPYSGTSVLAGMQAAVEAGLFGGYLWAFGTRDIAQAVLQRGPVVIGVPWLAGMADTGPGGLLRVTGKTTGGHCLAVVGLRMKGPQGQSGPFFVLQNSWGTDWGDDGMAYVHHRDLAGLLHGTGEAAIPTVEAQR